MFVLFAAPPEKEVDWRWEGADGIYRFLGRVYRFVTRHVEPPGPNAGSADRKVLRKLHQCLHKITEDFESRWHFNTCIASIMELVNVLYAEEENLSAPRSLAEVMEKLALMLAPFAPYLSPGDLGGTRAAKARSSARRGRRSIRNWPRTTKPRSWSR